MSLLIKNGRLLDPSVPIDAKKDLWIEDGIVKKIEDEISDKADQVIDAKDCYVMPGFIDLHVHLREPGYEYKETIQTGSRAAARGGFTSICPMPNTKPATDTPEKITQLLEKAKKEAVVHILPVGAITIDQAGKELADIAGMKRAGAVAISEDGKSVMDAFVYRRAMLMAKEADILVMAHCEDKSLAGKGSINQGKVSEKLNIEGISNAVEDTIVIRDILLAKETKARLHLCHCSTKDSVAFTMYAKEHNISVSAEVCPHHFTLSDEDMRITDSSVDANFKMNPPLRSREDVLALKEGLRDGIMEAISTDHAPHHEEEKKKPLKEAPFGIVGLETAVPLTITELVDKGYLTPLGMAEKMSTNPAKILKIDKGSLKVGKIADITIIDPNEEYRIDKNEFVSKGKNSPFHGRLVKGRVKATVVDGMVVYQYHKK